uniref:Uncharacterized protein n=1 Tax=Anguilla anguilla TaxID=7936 RepID=A0A0E9PII7_ANGAN
MSNKPRFSFLSIHFESLKCIYKSNNKKETQAMFYIETTVSHPFLLFKAYCL